MSVNYRAIVGEIHAVNEEIKLLCRKKIDKRINNAFAHFENLSKVDIKVARFLGSENSRNIHLVMRRKK